MNTAIKILIVFFIIMVLGGVVAGIKGNWVMCDDPKSCYQ